MKSVGRLTFVGLGLATLITGSAMAQATRTWVSGVGDDVNPCSRTAPCKTFAGAISKTASGGIIDALDPGGFGAVTVTKPITIEGNGTLASILHSGVQGIIINITSGSNRDVTLRNILIDGSGTTLGTNGINFIAGDSLLVEDTYITNCSGSGILFQPNTTAKLGLKNVSISRCQTNGLLAKPVSPGIARVEVYNSYFFKNGSGIRIEDISNGVIDHSIATGNTGDGILSFSNAGGVDVLVSDCSVSANGGSGLRASGGNAAMRATSTVISGNITGVSKAGGILASFGDNVLIANTTQGSFDVGTLPHN